MKVDGCDVTGATYSGKSFGMTVIKTELIGGDRLSPWKQES